MAENLLPKFFDLLEEAHSASKEVDDYDFDGKSPESVARWNELLAAQRVACKALVYFCGMRPNDLFGQLEAIGE